MTNMDAFLPEEIERINHLLEIERKYLGNFIRCNQPGVACYQAEQNYHRHITAHDWIFVTKVLLDFEKNTEYPLTIVGLLGEKEVCQSWHDLSSFEECMEIVTDD